VTVPAHPTRPTEGVVRRQQAGDSPATRLLAVLAAAAVATLLSAAAASATTTALLAFPQRAQIAAAVKVSTRASVPSPRGSGTVSLSMLVCGQRTLQARVARGSGTGTFRPALDRP
jgi:hypothetical protein